VHPLRAVVLVIFENRLRNLSLSGCKTSVPTRNWDAFRRGVACYARTRAVSSSSYTGRQPSFMGFCNHFSYHGQGRHHKALLAGALFEKTAPDPAKTSKVHDAASQPRVMLLLSPIQRLRQGPLAIFRRLERSRLKHCGCGPGQCGGRP